MEEEEVSENWEEAAESGEIERRLEAKLKIIQNEVSGNSPIRTAIVIPDDSVPPAPPPQIRILKRPSSNGSIGPQIQARPTLQVKSLAQREAEYAEARRRILGSASAEETPQERDRPDSASTIPEQVRSNNHIIRQPRGPDGTQGFRLCR
ncbi:SUZ domain-containing protein 1-like isoform X3 [Chanos chanos]|uniref:SUZ RNA-binding domain-containing n=1 Tax=Chanos chanos TaxID=29144 RepID=A0A6J2VQF9_CHACN|nr:SUZ domain-containing protein 1-like isoform X3 [Chanos chanos]